VNLSWVQIMKTITDDPKSFFEEAGGWSFLSPDGDDGSMVESSESEFEAESLASVESSDSASSDESGFSESSGSGSGSGSGEESEGEDWDELEKKAMQVYCCF
jgi:nucleosome binding factor SPN SPT16 subunit